MKVLRAHVIGLVALLVLGRLAFMYLTPFRNLKRHSTEEYHFAHFSKIDDSNYVLYPSLLFTSPVRLTLKEGESLYIPARWWHWIRSSKSVAVNYWIIGRQMNKNERPFVFQTGQNYDEFLKKLNDYEGDINAWKSETDKLQTETQDSLHKSKDANYIITLSGYGGDMDKLNRPLLTYLEDYIPIPKMLNAIPSDKIDKNLWISTGNHDTGLHYDDYAGILTLMKGEKEVTLYPPEDSRYLCPFDLSPEWSRSNPLQVDYNVYHIVTTLNKYWNLPSARLLYESMKLAKNKKLLQAVSSLTNKVGVNKTVWGCKKKGTEIRWELYLYHYDMRDSSNLSNLENVCFDTKSAMEYKKSSKSGVIIHSIDLYNSETVIGDDIHVYHRLSKMSYPFKGYGTKFVKNGSEKESLFILDLKRSFVKNYAIYMKEIGLQDVDKFESYLGRMHCKYICVHNKFDGNIFIQYLGIDIEEFINFLNEYEYPKSLINHVVDNRKKYANIAHEITIVYDIKTMKAVRTGFYGLV